MGGSNRVDEKGSGMANFIEVGKEEDFPPGSAGVVDVRGVEVALVNVDGTFHAVQNECPHAGGPLGEGELSNFELECPLHGSVFDVRTGDVLVGPADEPIATYEVVVENGVVRVSID
jgi:nitrite reductase/ring-hydroxylating ferredoxin subunit